MSLEVVRVRPGPSSTAWLFSRIRDFQAGHPLAPLTVATPTHHAGLYLRRRLARETYANVRFSVLSRLAESIGMSRLAASGWEPLATVSRAALIRSALVARPGPFAAIAEQGGLVDLVAALATELRRRPDVSAETERLRRGATTTAKAALDAAGDYEELRGAAKLYDEIDLLGAATRALEAAAGDAAWRELGAVIVHLPAGLDPPDASLVRALATRIPVVVALADLGDDVDPATSAIKLLGEVAITAIPAASAPASASVVIAPDAVEEVRFAVRAVLAALEQPDPIPLYQQAIVYRDEEAYGQLLRDTLRESDVPYSALGGRPLLDSVAARGLLGVMRLREQEFSRSSVLSWLSALPDRKGVLRSQSRWDQLSRDAGVVKGASQWGGLLTAFADAKARTLELLKNTEPEDVAVEARRAAIARDIEDARRIVEQIQAIDETTQPPEVATWDALIFWTLRLRDEFVAPDSAWSPEELEASQSVEEAIRSLGAAQRFEPAASISLFVRTLEDALRRRFRPEGRLGHGVLIGPHRLLAGMDMRRVHVLGVLESSFPAAMPVDPLLGADLLGRRATHEATERRDWRIALATADSGELMVSAPSVDVDGRSVYPSPWLLELLGVNGSQPRASDVRAGAVDHELLRRIRSAERAVAEGTPLSIAERREAEAMRSYDAGGNLARTALALRDDLPLGRVLEVTRARHSSSLTEFDGIVADAAEVALISAGLTRTPHSATGIQTWATCPFSFLLGRLFQIPATADLDEDKWWQISALERGSMVHRILERFFGEVVTSGKPAPGDDYSSADLLRMGRIAAETFREWEVRGAVGHPLVWANERTAILADLRTLLEQDAELRSEGGWRPAHLEQAFGMDRDPASWPAVTITVGDDRRVQLRGYIDRVDVDASGRSRVLDYKTGRCLDKTITVDDLFDAGRRLQLAVYGRAVREHALATGKVPTDDIALYWYISVKGGFERVQLTVDDHAQDALVEVVMRIDEGVRAGCFPQVPGELNFFGDYDNCGYCAYNSLCPSSRDVVAASKAGSPGLARYIALRPVSEEANE
ncbi:MAG TPA: PD-(D/E)XK nuclease family protein [Candidatus Acidoferrales bacterium]|nr:PD-(D/E)XK nuclease family protein [Candidatus Acidoferrales bacterium]